MTGKNPSELNVKRRPWEQMLVKPDLLSSTSRSQSWYLQVEKVFAQIVIKLCSEVRPSFSDLCEWILTLICVPILESVQKFTDSIFQVDILRQSHDLNVHVGSFLELERTVSFEKQIVHALHIDEIIDEKVANLQVFIFKSTIEFKRVCNMFLGHNHEMVIAYRPFWHCNIEVLRLTPNNEISINAGILEAEPTVLVFLYLHTLHLKVDLEQATL